MVNQIQGSSKSAAGEYLDKSELRALTGRVQVNAQEAWLVARALPHRRDGARIIVSRFHVREWLESKNPSVVSEGPHWNVPGMEGYDPTKPRDWVPTKRL
jgi:hypothetical protein